MDLHLHPHPFFFLVTFLIFLSSIFLVSGQSPQTFFLQQGCSQYNATNITSFLNNRNTIFSQLRSQLNSSYFATAELPRVSTPIYAMTQCRDYLSTRDCLACFDFAAAQIRNCSAANGARVSFDGCFLRYESNNFYAQGTAEGDQGYCGNQTVSRSNQFGPTVVSLLQDMVTATPRVAGVYFTAAERRVAGSNTTVYAVAQCTRLTSATDCGTCLNTAVNNIAQCPPDTQARAVDAGCFMRYSASPFFNANQTVDLNELLSSGSSDNNNRRNAIIGGVVGGGGGLLLILFIWFFFFHSKNSKSKERGRSTSS